MDSYPNSSSSDVIMQQYVVRPLSLGKIDPGNHSTAVLNSPDLKLICMAYNSETDPTKLGVITLQYTPSRYSVVVIKLNNSPGTELNFKKLTTHPDIVLRNFVDSISASIFYSAPMDEYAGEYEAVEFFTKKFSTFQSLKATVETIYKSLDRTGIVVQFRENDKKDTTHYMFSGKYFRVTMPAGIDLVGNHRIYHVNEDDIVPLAKGSHLTPSLVEFYEQMVKDALYIQVLPWVTPGTNMSTDQYYFTFYQHQSLKFEIVSTVASTHIPFIKTELAKLSNVSVIVIAHYSGLLSTMPKDRAYQTEIKASLEHIYRRLHNCVIIDLQREYFFDFNNNAPRPRRTISADEMEAHVLQNNLNNLPMIIANESHLPLSDLFEIKTMSPFLEKNIIAKLHAISNIAPIIYDRKKTPVHTPYQGGMHIDPAKGVHDGLIANVDFASFYPSILMEHTSNNTPGFELIPGSERSRQPLNQILTRYVHLRRATTGPMAMVFKLVTNSLYGYLAYRRSLFYNVKLAAAITERGRAILTHAIEITHQSSNLKVILANTDGFFVKSLDWNPSPLANGQYEKFKDQIDHICAVVNQPYNYINLVLGKIYSRCIIYGKTKYGAKLYGDTKCDIVGMEDSSRSFCALIRNTVRDAVTSLLLEDATDIEIQKEAVNNVNNALRDVIAKKDYKQLAITTTVGTLPDPNDTDAHEQPHIQAMHFQRREIYLNQKITWVQTLFGPRLLDWCEHNPANINPSWYANVPFTKVLQRIFSFQTKPFEKSMFIRANILPPQCIPDPPVTALRSVPTDIRSRDDSDEERPYPLSFSTLDSSHPSSSLSSSPVLPIYSSSSSSSSSSSVSSEEPKKKKKSNEKNGKFYDVIPKHYKKRDIYAGNYKFTEFGDKVNLWMKAPELLTREQMGVNFHLCRGDIHFSYEIVPGHKFYIWSFNRFNTINVEQLKILQNLMTFMTGETKCAACDKKRKEIYDEQDNVHQQLTVFMTSLMTSYERATLNGGKRPTSGTSVIRDPVTKKPRSK